MRILVVGKRGGVLQWFESVVDAGRGLDGIEICSFAVNYNSATDRLWKNLLKASRWQWYNRAVAGEFLSVVKSFQPDLVLIVDWIYIPQELFEVLNSAPKRPYVAWWIGDLFDRQRAVRAGCVDKFYFTDSHFMEYAAQEGIISSSYLPLACNANIYQHKNHGKRDARLVFVGAYADNRENVLREIKRPVLVVGKHWEKLSGSEHAFRARRVSVQNVARYYNQHIGVLNIKNSGNVVNGLNMRTFDAPACGCVVLNDNMGDLDRCFEIDKEILVYHNPDELNALYERIVADDVWRRDIAVAGERRVMNEHLYTHRLQTIISDLF